ncbi:MAG: 2-oxo acid dehydrogenase subunit E2, partial [Planctomycetaceae bacterium]
ATLLSIEESAQVEEDQPDTPPEPPPLAAKREPREPAKREPREPAKREPAVKRTGDETAQTSRAVSRIAERESDGRNRPPAPAAPSTRRLARELSIDLHHVEGTGPGGRITTDDVKSFVRGRLSSGMTTTDVSAPMAAPTLPDFTKFGPVERQPMNKLSRISAHNLSIAWQQIPHVTQHDLADVTDLEAARKQYLASAGKTGPKVTMTAIMVKAVVGALRTFPHFNSSYDAGAAEIIIKRYFHIGVAVDTEYGLVVPVIRDADQKTVLDIADELTDLADRARARKLQMDEMQGGTFTITNLGGIGGTSFTPIINHPEVAILGLSRGVKQLELRNGQPVERLKLPLSLSYDHRVINGADAARFIVRLSGILSDFFQLMVTI